MNTIWEVCVERSVTQYTFVQVEAENETQAATLAMEEAAVASSSEWDTVDGSEQDYHLSTCEDTGKNPWSPTGEKL